jgi:hypothetical protein
MECIGLRSFIISPPFVPVIEPEHQAQEVPKVVILERSEESAFAVIPAEAEIQHLCIAVQFEI